MSRVWIEDQNPARGPENSGHFLGPESPVLLYMYDKGDDVKINGKYRNPGLYIGVFC